RPFPVVIVDIRAYHAREDLAANNSVLLDYVRQGGTALVMYQKTFEWKPEYAPYPIQVSTNRVGAENAPVTLLVPDHPLFTTPNAIAPEDWLGWVQERGLYIPDAWDEHYTPLVRTNDPGEDIPPGSCLICDYGEGIYLYTSLVWYRQLREAHPGALRVFANMLALGK
nr:LmbE family protein [Candidatus Hydrogenedentota bacterium]